MTQLQHDSEIQRIDFVVPLRAKTTTNNWSRTCELLAQTVSSILNSRDDRLRVLISCHDTPEQLPHDSRIEILPVPFAPPLSESKSFDTAKRLFVWETDKGRKLLYGIERARASGTRYFMPTDADDLISSKLVGWCLEQNHPYGYFIDEGYRLNDENLSRVYYRRRFFKECGSSAILRTQLAPFPHQPDYSLDLNDRYTRRYVVHAYLPESMARQGNPLKPVPFPSAVYRFHEQNIFAASARRQDSPLRRWLRELIKGRPVDDALRAEFLIGNGAMQKRLPK